MQSLGTHAALMLRTAHEVMHTITNTSYKCLMPDHTKNCCLAQWAAAALTAAACRTLLSGEVWCGSTFALQPE